MQLIVAGYHMREIVEQYFLILLKLQLFINISCFNLNLTSIPRPYPPRVIDKRFGGRAACHGVRDDLRPVRDEDQRHHGQPDEILVRSFRDTVRVHQDRNAPVGPLRFSYKFRGEPVGHQIVASSLILAIPKIIGDKIILNKMKEYMVKVVVTQVGRLGADFEQRPDKSKL
jgi:hypothetical protein